VWDGSGARLLEISCVLAALLMSAPVQAEDASLPSPIGADGGGPTASTPPRSIALDLGVGTWFPLAVGAEATVELPYRILGQASVGWMPQPYSNAIIGVLGDFSVLSSPEQTLIEESIQSSLAVQLSAGWRPFPSLGLEVFGGYTLLTAGGSVTASDAADAYLQSKGSSDRYSGSSQQGIPLRATLQSFHGTVDYRFLLWDDRIVLRVSLTYLQCFASSTSVTATPTRAANTAALAHLNEELQGYLNPYFTEYVKAPIVGLTAAYRF
jgi:hypothetical protein